MNKRKIAIFATGWSPEIIQNYILGLREGLEKENVDIYLFLNYAHVTSQKNHAIGELNIYNLPDMHDFSAAVIIGNGLDFDGLFESIIDRCREANIPTVCTGREGGAGTYFVGPDNRIGAEELYDHIISEHNCRDIIFMAGHKDNPDSMIRLEALKTCLAKVGVSLPEENIFYTNWAPSEAATFTEEWCKAGKKMPDAFVCANDVLAMPVCDTLIAYGYNIPEDVIITGFDNEFFSKIYDPAITSVDQCFEKVGAESAQIILDLLNGIQREERTFVASRFVPSESCGCFSKFCADNDRRVACKKFFHNNIKQSLFTAQLALLESKLLEGTTVDDFGENYYSYLMDYRFQYENDTFYLLLEPAYEKSIYDSNVVFNTNKYSDIMKIAVALDGGQIVCHGEMDRRKLIPFTSADKTENRFFVFLPIHNREYNYGYAVLGDDVDKIGDYNYLSSYVSRLSIILQLYKQRLSMNYMNEKLVEFGITDPLTKVKNRSAYKEMEEKLSEIIKSVPDYSFAIVMFDINNLKRINDDYGHEAGDQYIVGACNLIHRSFGTTLYRIGGDEFVAVLRGEELSQYEDNLEVFQMEMGKLKKAEIPLYERYSVATGIAVYDSSQDKTIKDVFNRADVAMYKNKVEMKMSGLGGRG